MTATEETIVIDPDIRALIPPLREEEMKQLEENLKAEGCRDPLVIWAESGILLDGHNRKGICERHGIPYRVEELAFDSREAACDWVDANQLGRRNLTPDQAALLRGRRYNRLRKAQGGDRKSSVHSAHLKTAEALGKQHGVNESTIRRDGVMKSERCLRGMTADRLEEPMDFTVDDEFRSRLRKLSKDEKEGLERLLVEKGCLNPLLIWDEENILLDGHNRRDICERRGIPYEVKRVSFANREEALLWVLRHQRDKRNSTDGEKYAMTREIRKLLAAHGRDRQAHGKTGPGRTLLSNTDKNALLPDSKEELLNAKNPSHDTRQAIARELGWSTGKVAQADYAWEHGGRKLRDKLLRGDCTVNQAYREAKKRKRKGEREAARAARPSCRPPLA